MFATFPCPLAPLPPTPHDQQNESPLSLPRFLGTLVTVSVCICACVSNFSCAIKIENTTQLFTSFGHSLYSVYACLSVSAHVFALAPCTCEGMNFVKTFQGNFARVLRVYICAMLHQNFGDLPVASLHGHEQRGVARCLHHVDVCLVLHQQFAHVSRRFRRPCPWSKKKIRLPFWLLSAYFQGLFFLLLTLGRVFHPAIHQS